ncbi:glycosyltransferase [Tuberibacillus sp. Marseille-P3662]|uniref:glycosyltransferase n=1 Tax=Tuberibacillus sp. Marseille-P3662 TaxID=1965358 RepID=UPI000A1CE0D7|nr:glycosyltransferase [Tuberibacillus sp. Marseille-P3662]
MKRVLIFANPYPPMQSIGTKRITKFIKYMKENGWEPVVIAPKVAGSDDFDRQSDIEVIRVPIVGPTQLYNVARSLFPRKNKQRRSHDSATERNSSVKKSRSSVFNQWLFIPDEYIFWSVSAVSKALKYIKRHPVDLCFVSGPAYSSFVSGVLFSKLAKIKLITDFRDPWIDSEFLEYKTNAHFALNRWLEKQVVKQSEKVTTVSPAIKDMFSNRYLEQNKFSVLFNGFDQDDLPERPLEIPGGGVIKPITITHTGTFYGQKNPSTFLEGLSLFKQRHPKSDFVVNFVGGIHQEYLQYARDHELEVIDTGRVTYSESLIHQQQGDALLLIPGPGKGTITGKFFEYLNAKKPIFCVGIPGSDLDYLINRTHSGLLADVSSPEDIADKLSVLLEAWQRDTDLFTFEDIESFEFRHLTGQLTAIFDQETNSSSSERGQRTFDS